MCDLTPILTTATETDATGARTSVRSNSRLRNAASIPGIAGPSWLLRTEVRAPGLGGLGRQWCLLIVLPLLVPALITACSKAPAQSAKPPRDISVPVKVAKVESVPLDRTLAVVGTLAPRTDATIAAQVEGQIQKALLDFGEQAAASQELALIDTDSYEALVRQSAAAVAKAKANALNAENNLKRVLELQQSKISSASDLDSATAQAEQARAEVKQAEAADAIARLNLQRSHVIAPFPGTISERIVNTGDYVKIGSPLFRLVEDGELKYVVQAPERYAALVKPGQTVELSVDAWPDQTFRATVYLVSPSVSTATRSFYLAARVDNSDRKLKANSFARGELVLERAVPTPVIPLEAVVNFAGVTKVFVIQNDSARSREIKTGRIKDGRQEVTEGLETGEVVALTGTTRLFEMAKVRVQAP
ncbi:MAG TPA: efflux RND transporter periplasmic adaptor subunit [Verrucomicrobiae bacterium]